MRHKLDRDLVALMRGLLLIPVAIALLGAAKLDPVAIERANQDYMNYQEVSIIALIANPTPFDGKRVRVSGYVTLRFEDSGLHFDKAAYDAGLRKNALRIDPPRWLAKKDAARLSDRFATVFATFHARDEVMGDHDHYSGTLEDLQRVSPTFTSADWREYLIRGRNAVFLQQLRPGLLLALLIAAIATFIARLIIKRQRNP